MTTVKATLVHPTEDRRDSVSQSIIAGCTCYVLSSLLIFLGGCAGFSVLRPERPIAFGEHELLLRFAAWDGEQFVRVMDEGYRFERDKMSNIVVFPGFPLIAKLVQLATGMRSAAALLLVSHLCLCLTFSLLHRYLRLRTPETPAAADWTLTAFAFFPTTFFFHMAYSESMFLLLAIIVLYGVQRRWRLTWLCLAVGAATGVRAVGVMLILPVLLSALERGDSRRSTIVAIGVNLPLCFWGLMAFMLFQQWEFGDAFAFSKSQANFYLRPPVSSIDHWYRLVTLEPVWANYLSESSAYWKNHSSSPPAFLNLQFANPVYFVLTAILLFAGWQRRWVTDGEAAFGLGLLLMSYVSRAEEFCMGCQGRYAATAIPVFMVWGQILIRLPHALRQGIVAIWVGLMTCYSALFAAWYFYL